MNSQFFANLANAFRKEIDSEFHTRFPIWNIIPESRTAKVLHLIRSNSANADRLKTLLVKKCHNMIEQIGRGGGLNALGGGNRQEWDDILAGDGAVWGIVSVVEYKDYSELNTLATAALKLGRSVTAGEFICRDGIPISMKVLTELSVLKPPKWGLVEKCLRATFIDRLGWHEVSPWAEISFEKQITKGDAICAHFDRIRGGFGFDYNISLRPASGFPFQISYERTLGIGIGLWDRISSENLDNACSSLALVVARLTDIIEACGDPGGGGLDGRGMAVSC